MKTNIQLQTTDLKVYRNKVELIDTPDDGFLNLSDGSSGEPDIIMSPTTYIYEHIAELMVVVKDKNEENRICKIEALINGINTVILNNETLEPDAKKKAAELFGDSVETASYLTELLYKEILFTSFK